MIKELKPPNFPAIYGAEGFKGALNWTLIPLIYLYREVGAYQFTWMEYVPADGICPSLVVY